MTTNNFKPILFSTEMVQAILAGRKTQTRRIIKPQPSYLPYTDSTEGHENTLKTYINVGLSNGAITAKLKIGDILWVRETFCPFGYDFIHKANPLAADLDVKWKPSLFMPKKAARIFLKVTNVRCEKLQDISEEDAIAEGIYAEPGTVSGITWYQKFIKESEARSDGLFTESAKECFQTLWQSINAKKHPWESNPWVWAYDFERIEKPANFI